MSGYPTALGDYEVRGILGFGVSGTVFLAHQSLIDRDVALKQLRAELTAQPEFLERFRAEAEVMARLANDHCVKVFDFFERGGHAYLVSELVAGVSLRKLVGHGGLRPEQALGVLKGALQGLERSHELGLVHRDIKPENILLDTEGTSKLADFGLAGAVEGPGAASGMPSGSPAYMSPEMVSGAVVDTRSDLYSAGAVLFELLTRRPPFVAEGPLAVMRMHRQAPVPDPRQLNGNLGPGVAGLVMASLAKDPSERPQTAGQMLGALETTAAEAYGPDWESRSSVKREVAAAVGAGLGLLAMLGTAGAIAATGAVGSAITAAAAGSAGGATVSGGVQGLSTWVIAAGAAAVLVLGGGVFALASGALGGHHVAVAIPTPSPSVLLSPSPVVSPSPSELPSPSPSPEASPSPSPSPTPAVTAKPKPKVTARPTPSIAPPPPSKPGPMTLTNIQAFFEVCDGSGNNCQDPVTFAPNHPIDASPYRTFATRYQVGLCDARTLKIWETYSWTYPGPAGTSTPVSVNWSGDKVIGAIDTPVNDQFASASLPSGQSGAHAAMISPPEFAPKSAAPPKGGQVTFYLSWTNPNDGSTPKPALPYTFNWGCG